MDYMMLEPYTNEFKGFVSDKQVRKELNLTGLQFKRFVQFSKLYKGCLLIEDDSKKEQELIMKKLRKKQNANLRKLKKVVQIKKEVDEFVKKLKEQEQ